MLVAQGIYESPTDRDISGLIIAYSISVSLLIVSEVFQRYAFLYFIVICGAQLPICLDIWKLKQLLLTVGTAMFQVL